MKFTDEMIDRTIEKFFDEYKKKTVKTFTVNVRGVIKGFWIFGALFSLGFVGTEKLADILSLIESGWETFFVIIGWFMMWPVVLGEEIARIIAGG